MAINTATNLPTRSHTVFWFVVIASVFVTSLITANIIAVKLILFLGFLVPAGIIVFPLVFLLTFMAATRQQPFLLLTPGMRKGWLSAHIALIFIGYAALILSFCASLLYLIQQRSLKSKFTTGQPWHTAAR